MDQGVKFCGMELALETSAGVGKEVYEFQGADLEPPQGAFGMNYARCCHKERNAYRWWYAWTTERNLDADRRGNFYIADYLGYQSAVQ
jgi:hypothetical protein